MGFQTLVILQGQAPDTPTLLEAFLQQETGSNGEKKYRLTKALLGKWFMLNIETLVVYGLLERDEARRRRLCGLLLCGRVLCVNTQSF